MRSEIRNSLRRISRKDVWRKVLEIYFAARVLDVEVAVVLENVGGRHFPGAIVLFSFVPPGDAVCKIFKLNRLSFSVVLPAFGERLLVVPDIFRGAGAVEEHEIGWNARVGRKDAVRQSNNGVEIEVLSSFSLMRAQTPSPKRVPFGTTTPARPHFEI